ncbi:MAG: SagB/ThcOx family dehydrogenase [Acidobacteriia bacterium]|nr:SagB/ThcOx family dehydrogenase [Terriglobia bacterium]
MKSLNQEILRALSYHENTKHSYESVRARAHHLDWANQPNPFRSYQGAQSVKLPRDPKLPAIDTLEILVSHSRLKSINSPREMNASGGDSPLQASVLLGNLLWHSMAISAWKQIRGTDIRYSLRVNPSSGNLHPTETHLITNGCPGMPDGIYHYFVPDHELECRRKGDLSARLAGLVEKPWIAECPIIVVLTSVFWREAWKYRSRAYRYCNHDLGHAAASFLVAARALGFNGCLVGNFPDETLAELIGIDRTDEWPMLILPLWPQRESLENLSIRNSADRGESRSENLHLQADEDVCLTPIMGTPNALSEEIVPYPLIDAVHQSTLLLDVDEFPSRALTGEPEGVREEFEHPRINLPTVAPSSEVIGIVVRRRRSALNYDPKKGDITFEQFSALMLAAQAGFCADWRMNLPLMDDPTLEDAARGRDWIRLYLYVHRVRDLEAGLYLYHPQQHALEQYARANIQHAAAYLSLEQSLAGNSCVTFSMVAGLDAALKTFGNRGYRYCHNEAGFIGQQLYLAAEALGFNATGIGAFYDDAVHEFLQLTPDRGQVVYHFSVGHAVEDDRLVGEDVVQIA